MMRLFYDRGIRLAAGLAVVVAIPMAVLFYFQFKSLNDIETTSAVVLRQDLTFEPHRLRISGDRIREPPEHWPEL